MMLLLLVHAALPPPPIYNNLYDSTKWDTFPPQPSRLEILLKLQNSFPASSSMSFDNETFCRPQGYTFVTT